MYYKYEIVDGNGKSHAVAKDTLKNKYQLNSADFDVIENGGTLRIEEVHGILFATKYKTP